MEQLSNGNVILAYEEASSHPDNTDDVLHIRFSDDYGENWTDEDTDLDGNPVAGFPAYPPGATPADDYGPGGTYIWQAPNDDIYLHCWKVDYSTQDCQGAWRIKSTDGGITWGAWEQLEIIGQTAAENLKTEFEEVHFIYAGDIYAICRVYGPSPWGDVKAIFIKSVDNGATWTKISDLSTYDEGTHEMAAEYLGNNNIIVIARDSGNVLTFYITSDDMGVTWSPVAHIESSFGVVGRPRMFTDAHLKGESNWWTDNNLILYGFEIANGTGVGRRNAVWLSDDHGETWNGPQYLDEEDDDGGYGDLLYDPVNDIYRVVTYKGNYSDADLVQYDFSVNW